MALATPAEISSAIDLIDVKKQNLHKSFLHLQSHPSFNLPLLNWPDIDSYFTSLHSSLQSKFRLLQTLSPPPVPAPPDSPAPDAPVLVLDALSGFYNPSCTKAELDSFRSGCLVMLKNLLRANPDVAIELKDRAMEIAVEWKKNGNVCSGEQEALGFVILVGAFGLVDRFRIDDIVDCFLVIAADRDTIDLCRRIVPANRINYMIQKLIEEGMHFTAVKFSIEFKKTNVFPPVALLEERKLMAMKVMDEKRRDAKYLDVWNIVTIEGIRVLELIIKCIDENHLELEYPKDCVVELVNKLQNELENSKNVKGLLRKQPPRATVLKQQLRSRSKMSKKSTTPNKVQPTAVFAAATPVQSAEVIRESLPSHRSDLSPDHIDECRDPQVGSSPAAGFNAAAENDSVVEHVNEVNNEVEDNNQTAVNDLGLRKQPPRAAAQKKKRPLPMSKVSKKSKKPKLNKLQPTAGSAVAAAPVESVEVIRESPPPQRSALSPDHVDKCHDPPVGSSPAAGFNAPSTNDNVVEVNNEVEDSNQTAVNNVGLRKQPARAAARKRKRPLRMLKVSKKSMKSKKPKLNKVQPTAAESVAAATPVESIKSIQESRSQKPDSSPADHVGGCPGSPLGSDLAGSIPPCEPVAVEATPVESIKLIHESHSQKSDSSPDHAGGCPGSPLGSDRAYSNAPFTSPVRSLYGSTGAADIDCNFFGTQLEPPSDNHSNGWISE